MEGTRRTVRDAAKRYRGCGKAALSAPTPDDAKHLAVLRDRMGESFVGGVVFHTGPHAYRLGEGIVAAPISALWS